MTVLDVLIEIVIILTVSLAANKFFMRKWKKPIEIVVHPHVDNWIDIKKTPIPSPVGDLGVYNNRVLLTCGNTVDV